MAFSKSRTVLEQHEMTNKMTRLELATIDVDSFVVYKFYIIRLFAIILDHCVVESDMAKRV